MGDIPKILINKYLVHKKEDKNVFLFNLRRKFPNYFEKSLFETILNQINPEEKVFLQKYYLPVSAEKISFLDKNKDTYYMIYSVINSIDFEKIECIENNISDDEKKMILSFYNPDKNNNCYSLVKDVNEEEEKLILKALDDKKHFISDETKKEIADILEKIDGIPKGDIVYANMHVNLTHDFFFEHPNEHVPGMMILETFRQFFVAVSLVIGKVPVKDAQLVLDSLESKFYKYTELAFPIIFKGYIKECKWNKEGYYSYLDFEADVFQNSNIVAHFHGMGQSMSKKLFYRVRRIEKEKKIKDHRYVLVPDCTYKFAIKQSEDTKYIMVNLENISLKGFMLKSCNFEYGIVEGNKYDFFLFFQEIGFIHGKCRQKWYNAKNDTAGFEIISIEDDDLQNLRNAILSYCKIYNKRGIY